MRRDHCDGCGQSWRKVHSGPMLTNNVWLGICDQDTDVLCDQCIRIRIVQVYHRPLRFDDLKPCEYNVFCNYCRELAPPEMKAEAQKLLPIMKAEWDRAQRNQAEITAILKAWEGRTQPSMAK